MKPSRPTPVPNTGTENDHIRLPSRENTNPEAVANRQTDMSNREGEGELEAENL
jgi:hypothetical protein